MLNVRRADLEKVLATLPALKNPTVSRLSDSEMGGGEHDPGRDHRCGT
jgi:ATP phosphoribosyltransferase